MPLLSICIPTYNRSATLEATLKSLDSIKNDNIEIVVSNNASTDNTVEIMKKCSSIIDIQNNNKENIGANLNIIKVASLATGDYILFLSDEDTLSKEGIDGLLNIIEKLSVGVVFSSIANHDSNVLYQKYKFTKEYSKLSRKVRLFLFEHAYMSGLCIRRDIIDFNFIEKFQKNNSDYSYPHQIMILMALLKYSCMHYKEVVAIRGADEGSCYYVNTDKGKLMLYYSPSVRARLISHYLDLISILVPQNETSRFYKKTSQIAFEISRNESFKEFPDCERKEYTRIIKSYSQIRLSYCMNSVRFVLAWSFRRVKSLIKKVVKI